MTIDMTRLALVACLALVAACSESTSTLDDQVTTDTTDITDLIFDSRDAACTTYTGSFTSSVLDVGRNLGFDGAVEVAAGSGLCTITSNSIPNHDFNDGGNFANVVQEVGTTFSVEGSPSDGMSTTPLSLNYDNAVFLNGVKLDLLAAACYGVGGEPLGQERIGCFTAGTPWRYDPMYGKTECI